MPSRACPHCDSEFVTLRLLDIHIRHNHPEGAAKPSPLPPPLEQSPCEPSGSRVNVATYHDPTHESGTNEASDENQSTSGTLLSFRSSTEAYIFQDVSVDSMEDIYVLRAAEPGVPPIPPLLPPPRKPKQDRKPKQKLDPTTRSFKVVYEAKGYHETQRFRVPSTESYGTFLDRMAQVSTPVAGSFITGRDTGFTKDDGSWKYSLVSKKLNIEQPGVELTSNIIYQAMISELVKAHSPWSWVNVWHVSV